MTIIQVTPASNRELKVGQNVEWMAAPKCGCAAQHPKLEVRRIHKDERFVELFTCSGSQMVNVAQLLVDKEVPEQQPDAYWVVSVNRGTGEPVNHGQYADADEAHQHADRINRNQWMFATVVGRR